jgi:hypothetical protein
MKSKMKNCIPALAVNLALLMAVLAAAPFMSAQAPARFLGSITAIASDTLTVKPDAGDPRQVQVPSSATVKRIAPGEKDLSKAETIQFSDLAIGDRVLVRLDPNAPAGTPQALQIIAIKQADVAKMQQQENEEWQRGPHGLVKSVDSASGTVMLTTGAGPTAKTVAVHTTKATTIKRYAAGSVRFEEAQAATFDAIHAGDQLHARGTMNAAGTEFAADEVVSGSFRNVSGTITSSDATASTLVVKDLATKKQVTIHVNSESQMRRLPDAMATMLGAMLKGGDASSAGGRGAYAGQRGGGQGRPGAAGGGRGGFDPMQMLNRAPAIQLAGLKKGEAVMLVATQGATDVTAITLWAGVEPLLEAPAASNLLSNWSMGSGSPEGGQ